MKLFLKMGILWITRGTQFFLLRSKSKSLTSHPQHLVINYKTLENKLLSPKRCNLKQQTSTYKGQLEIQPLFSYSSLSVYVFQGLLVTFFFSNSLCGVEEYVKSGRDQMVNDPHPDEIYTKRKKEDYQKML